MPIHDVIGGECEGCGGWTGNGGVKLCIDCKRERARPVMKKCEWKGGCENRFRKLGRAKFCIEHRYAHGGPAGPPPPPPT
jgi:hypothetical protein